MTLVPLLAACAADADDDTIAVDSVESGLTSSAPPELAVPEGNHVAAAYHAVGFQVYECRVDSTGKYAWAFRAPVALLTADDGALVAAHFGGIDANLAPGPYWQSTLDGSRVHAGSPLSVPNPGAIPLLRLTALDNEGAGIFGDVTFLQRLETTGGVGPSGSCKKNSPRAYVPYTAAYVFWAASLTAPTVPETLGVPAGNDLARVAHATGVQIYECAVNASGAQVWGLRAPRAELSDADGLLATHFGGVDASLPAGPYWQSVRDGSRVHAGSAISAPNPGSIAFLRLTALDTAGNGILSRVSYIHRLATQGGVGPSGACPTLGEKLEVPYEADYYFYVPRN